MIFCLDYLCIIFLAATGHETESKGHLLQIASRAFQEGMNRHQLGEGLLYYFKGAVNVLSLCF